MKDFQFINGDCLEEMITLPDSSVDMIFADLPYGQNYRYSWDVIIPFDTLWIQLKRLIKEDGVVVMTGQQPFTSDIVASNKEWFRYEWVWDKHIPKGMHQAKQQPMRKHENVIIFSKNYKHNYYPIKVPRDKPMTVRNVTKNSKGGVGNYIDNNQEFTYTDKNPTSIITGCWEANRGYVRYHPTQKPVSLMEYLIRTYTKEEDTVLDPCAGSFTTGVACKRLNRHFIGIEKDENYFNIGKNRVLNP